MARLNHLHLHVRDLDKSRDFYRKHFGFSDYVMHGAVAFLRDEAGGLDLALAPVEQLDDFPEWFHFGFRLTSSQAVVDLYESLDANSIVQSLEQEQEQEQAFVGFRCVDPDGYRIEVYWEPEVPASD